MLVSKESEDLQLASVTPVIHLPRFVLRRADVDQGETGLLLHKDAVIRRFTQPGHYSILIWDDLVPILVLDRRSLVRVRTQPFTLTLRYPGLPTGDGGYVLCQATVTLAVHDPTLFIHRFGTSATLGPVAEAIGKETWTPLEAEVRQYQTGVLCSEKQLAQRLAADLLRRCQPHLESWGLRAQSPGPLLFLPRRRAEAALERIGDALEQRGIFTADDIADLLEDMPKDSEESLEAVSEVFEDLLEEEGPDSHPQDVPLQKDSPFSKAAVLISLALTTVGISGGAVAQAQGAVGQFVGPAAGPLTGYLVSAPLAMGVKWTFNRLQGKRGETQKETARQKAQSKEREAWAQVQLRRAQSDLYAALSDLSAWGSAAGRDSVLTPMLRDAETQLRTAIASLGAGFPAEQGKSRLNRDSREALLAMRFFVPARALPKLSRMAVQGRAEPVSGAEAVLTLARRAASSLADWQTYRMGLRG